MEMVGEVCPHCRVGRMKAFFVCGDSMVMQRQEKLEAVVRCDSLQCDGYLTTSPWQSLIRLENPLAHLPPASHGPRHSWRQTKRGNSLSSSSSTHSSLTNHRLLTSCSSLPSTSTSSIRPSHYLSRLKRYEQLKSSGPRRKGPRKSSLGSERPLSATVNCSQSKNPPDPAQSIDSQFLDDLLSTIELECGRKENDGLQCSTNNNGSSSITPSYPFTDDELMNLWMDDVDNDNKASAVSLTVEGSQDRTDDPLAVLSNSDLNILNLSPEASSPPCLPWGNSVVSETSTRLDRDCTTPSSSIDIPSVSSSQVSQGSFDTPVDTCSDARDDFLPLGSQFFSSPATSAASEDSGYNEEEGKLVTLPSDTIKVRPVYPPSPLLSATVRNTKAAMPSLPQEDNLKQIMLLSSAVKQPSPDLRHFSVHPALVTAGKCAVREEEKLQQDVIARPPSQEESLESSNHTVERVERGVELLANTVGSVGRGLDLGERSTDSTKDDPSNTKEEEDSCMGSGGSSPSSTSKVPSNEDITEVSSQYGSVPASDDQESSRASCSELSTGEAASPCASGSFRDVQKKGKGKGRGKRRGKVCKEQAAVGGSERTENQNSRASDRIALRKEAETESGKRARAALIGATRQTRQRTGSIEVQAPSRDPVTPSSSWDPVDPSGSIDPGTSSGRRGLSSLLQGPSWKGHNKIQLCRNLTNLGLRSLLTAAVNRDPWSVAELYVEELCIELVVQGRHQPQPGNVGGISLLPCSSSSRLPSNSSSSGTSLSSTASSSSRSIKEDLLEDGSQGQQQQQHWQVEAQQTSTQEHPSNIQQTLRLDSIKEQENSILQPSSKDPQTSTQQKHTNSQIQQLVPQHAPQTNNDRTEVEGNDITASDGANVFSAEGGAEGLRELQEDWVTLLRGSEDTKDQDEEREPACEVGRGREMREKCDSTLRKDSTREVLDDHNLLPGEDHTREEMLENCKLLSGEEENNKNNLASTDKVNREEVNDKSDLLSWEDCSKGELNENSTNSQCKEQHKSQVVHDKDLPLPKEDCQKATGVMSTSLMKEQKEDAVENVWRELETEHNQVETTETEHNQVETREKEDPNEENTNIQEKVLARPQSHKGTTDGQRLNCGELVRRGNVRFFCAGSKFSKTAPLHTQTIQAQKELHNAPNNIQKLQLLSSDDTGDSGTTFTFPCSSITQKLEGGKTGTGNDSVLEASAIPSSKQNSNTSLQEKDVNDKITEHAADAEYSVTESLTMETSLEPLLTLQKNDAVDAEHNLNESLTMETTLEPLLTHKKNDDPEASISSLGWDVTPLLPQKPASTEVGKGETSPFKSALSVTQEHLPITEPDKEDVLENLRQFIEDCSKPVGKKRSTEGDVEEEKDRVEKAHVEKIEMVDCEHHTSPLSLSPHLSVSHSSPSNSSTSSTYRTPDVIMLPSMFEDVRGWLGDEDCKEKDNLCCKEKGQSVDNRETSTDSHIEGSSVDQEALSLSNSHNLQTILEDFNFNEEFLCCPIPEPLNQCFDPHVNSSNSFLEEEASGTSSPHSATHSPVRVTVLEKSDDQGKDHMRQEGCSGWSSCGSNSSIKEISEQGREKTNEGSDGGSSSREKMNMPDSLEMLKDLEESRGITSGTDISAVISASETTKGTSDVDKVSVGTVDDKPCTNPSGVTQPTTSIIQDTDTTMSNTSVTKSPSCTKDIRKKQKHYYRKKYCPVSQAVGVKREREADSSAANQTVGIGKFKMGVEAKDSRVSDDRHSGSGMATQVSIIASEVQMVMPPCKKHKPTAGETSTCDWTGNDGSVRTVNDDTQVPSVLINLKSSEMEKGGQGFENSELPSFLCTTSSCCIHTSTNVNLSQKRKFEDEGCPEASFYKRRKVLPPKCRKETGRDTTAKVEEATSVPIHSSAARMCGVLDNSIVHDVDCCSSKHSEFVEYAGEEGKIQSGEGQGFQNCRVYFASQKCNTKQYSSVASSAMLESRPCTADNSLISLSSSTTDGDQTKITSKENVAAVAYGFGSTNFSPQFKHFGSSPEQCKESEAIDGMGLLDLAASANFFSFDFSSSNSDGEGEDVINAPTFGHSVSQSCKVSEEKTNTVDRSSATLLESYHPTKKSFHIDVEKKSPQQLMVEEECGSEAVKHSTKDLSCSSSSGKIPAKPAVVIRGQNVGKIQPRIPVTKLKDDHSNHKKTKNTNVKVSPHNSWGLQGVTTSPEPARSKIIVADSKRKFSILQGKSGQASGREKNEVLSATQSSHQSYAGSNSHIGVPLYCNKKKVLIVPTQGDIAGMAKTIDSQKATKSGPLNVTPVSLASCSTSAEVVTTRRKETVSDELRGARNNEVAKTKSDTVTPVRSDNTAEAGSNRVSKVMSNNTPEVKGVEVTEVKHEKGVLPQNRSIKPGEKLLAVTSQTPQGPVTRILRIITSKDQVLAKSSCGAGVSKDSPASPIMTNLLSSTSGIAHPVSVSSNLKIPDLKAMDGNLLVKVKKFPGTDSVTAGVSTSQLQIHAGNTTSMQPSIVPQTSVVSTESTRPSVLPQTSAGSTSTRLSVPKPGREIVLSSPKTSAVSFPSCSSAVLPAVSGEQSSSSASSQANMLKPVKCSSGGGAVYLRPTPALKTAIQEMRKKTKQVKQEGEGQEVGRGGEDSSSFLMLPDGDSIAPPVLVAPPSVPYPVNKKIIKKAKVMQRKLEEEEKKAKLARKKRRAKRLALRTKKIQEEVKQKVEETVERSRVKNEVPQMVAVLVGGRLHVYECDTTPSSKSVDGELSQSTDQ